MKPIMILIKNKLKEEEKNSKKFEEAIIQARKKPIFPIMGSIPDFTNGNEND